MSGTRQDPAVYAIVSRDQHAIHFRCAEPPKANRDKYADELLEAGNCVPVYSSADEAWEASARGSGCDAEREHNPYCR
jgi:hypothetical protein